MESDSLNQISWTSYPRTVGTPLCDALAVAEIIRRLPATLAYRKQHRARNRLRRYGDFFSAPEFEKAVEDTPLRAGSALQLTEPTQ
jgi:hypothetical protein